MLPMLWEPVRPSPITWREYWCFFFIFRSELSILVKTQPDWGGVEKGELGPGGGGMSRDGKDMGRSIYFIDFYGDK